MDSLGAPVVLDQSGRHGKVTTVVADLKWQRNSCE